MVVAQEEEEGDLDLTDNRQAATSVEVCAVSLCQCVCMVRAIRWVHVSPEEILIQVMGGINSCNKQL